jgi:chromosome segregation protein
MFHIRELEVVHWDYWRRFTLPLDASIVAIVGPNGSGKTTLLDALRTLFVLKCSGKRDWRRYVRRSNAGFAWVRAVVDNPRTPQGRMSRPFFPCHQDIVTLACRIRRAGGDWNRDYTIQDGDLPIEALEAGAEWLGQRNYQARLADGGLTPAIGKVLSLEQGETDKLCEYSPRALLELVFDVFGDKEVLDNYRIAREQQKNAQQELEQLGLELDRLKNQYEAKRQEANNFLEYRDLCNEVQVLEAEVIPRLRLAELRGAIEEERGRILREREELASRRHTHVTLREQLAAALESDHQAEAAVNTVREGLRAAEDVLEPVHDEVIRLRQSIKQRESLRQRVLREEGADAEGIERAHEAAQAAVARLDADISNLAAQEHELAQELADAQARKGPPQPAEVTCFRQRLDAAGIAHAAITDLLEIVDLYWQPAVEAALRPFRHILLLSQPADRQAAWQLGEAAEYRHFIVAERGPAPAPRPGSLAEVVRFSDPVPSWLHELLNRIRRVENVAAARGLPEGEEWITRGGYHRERRGARFIGVGKDYYFGELGRKVRLADREARLVHVREQLADKGAKRAEQWQQLDALRQRLLGFQATGLLAARAGEFAQAEEALPAAEAAERHAQAVRDAAREAYESHQQARKRTATDLANRQRDEQEARRSAEQTQHDFRAGRSAQAKRLLELRHRRRGMPARWFDATEIAALAEKYDGASGAERELGRLKHRIKTGDWVKDEQVLKVRDKLKADVESRSRDHDERSRHYERQRAYTDEARAAYISKLRATVRQYGKNLRSLGELAGIQVECPVPHLENDDLHLTQAGLEVKFDFDRKGAIGLNDGEASGGQQVMKSLILLIGLLMEEARPGGFVFIDEPFAHLDVANIDRVGAFLRATRAQYLLTTPVTHNANVFAPAQLTLVTRKKAPEEAWAQPIAVMRRAGA